MESPKIRAVLFDMEGIVSGNGWYSVFSSLGLEQEHERMKEKYLSGKYESYMDWTNEACEVLQSHELTKKQFMEIIKRIPFTEGAEQIMKIFKLRGYTTGIITGGLEALAERARGKLSLDYVASHCSISFGDDGKIYGWNLNPSDEEDKVNCILQFAESNYLLLEECAYVGHNDSDIPAMNSVGLPIAFGPENDDVRNAAKVVIEEKNLRKIIPYLPPLKV